jgi:hypothetical protein
MLVPPIVVAMRRAAAATGGIRVITALPSPAVAVRSLVGRSSVRGVGIARGSSLMLATGRDGLVGPLSQVTWGCAAFPRGAAFGGCSVPGYATGAVVS